MSLPIITIVKGRIEVLFTSISMIESVLIHPPDTVDIDIYPSPVCGLFFIDQGGEDRNRLEIDQFLFHIEIVHQEDNGRDAVLTQGELLYTTLHKELYADLKNGILHGQSVKMSRRPFTNEYEDENIGRVIMQYDMYIPHKFGDGFTKTNY